MPFLAGALIAYLANPLVTKLMRFHLSRLVSVIIVFSGIFLTLLLIILLLVPIIQKEIINLTSLIPYVVDFIQAKFFPWVTMHFNIQNANNSEALKTLMTEQLLKANELVSWFLGTVFNSGKAIVESIINIIIIPVVTFYLLRDWEILLNKIDKLIPPKLEPTIVNFAKECDEVLSAFFRGQLLVMLSLSIFYSLSLTLIGLQIGIVIGLIIGILSIVPYLGAIVGIVLAFFAALVQFGNLTSLLWVSIVFIIGHLIDALYLTPTLVGQRIGLHPVVVIFAILAGGTLFGFFGVLLALPLASVIMVFLKHLHRYYHKAYGRL